MTAKLDAFTKAYVECALWSSLDDDGQPLDRRFSVKDLAPAALEEMVKDCLSFQQSAGERLDTGRDSFKLGGRDFWLTRNRHGAGFWDGDWAEPNASELTRLAHAFGESYLYVGDDGLIHAM